MTEAMQAFVVDVMGPFFVEPPTFDLKGCYEDSSVTMPLIFVLSTGSDPNKVRLGQKYRITHHECTTYEVLGFSRLGGDIPKPPCCICGRFQPTTSAAAQRACSIEKWFRNELPDYHLILSWKFSAAQSRNTPDQPTLS